MKYVAYGLGQHFYKCINKKQEILESIVFLCDKNPDKWGRKLFDKLILSPSELAAHKTEFDRILVFSWLYYDEIHRELIEEHGFAESAITAYQLDDDDYYLGHIKYYLSYEPLHESLLNGALVLPDRKAALKYMPRNAICCEIGVAYGDFSVSILEEMQPKKFYAIDYFLQHDPYYPLLNRFDFELDNMPHKLWYENRFKEQIANGLVETRQGVSWEVLSQFPDDYFDYAYVDAGHDYESVKKDIDALQCKMKNGAYYQFNDYTAYNSSAKCFYGVVPAINQWVNSTQNTTKQEGNSIRAEVKFLCLHPFNSMDIVVQVFKR